MEIDGADGLRAEKGVERRLGFGRATLPERAAETIPGGGEALVVGIGILDDEPLECLRAAADDAETDGPAVVLNKKAVVLEALEGEEALGNLSQMIEGIRPGGGVGSVAQPKARVIGGQDVKPVGEGLHQVSVLMRRSGKAVKQDELGGAGPTRFTVGDG